MKNAMCGNNEEFYVFKEETQTFVCEHCSKLKERKCLNCNKQFMPGCKVKFLCYRCYALNQNQGNDTSYSTRVWH